MALQKVYVDVPATPRHEEAERYKYISDNVDDFDESLEEALLNAEESKYVKQASLIESQVPEPRLHMPSSSGVSSAKTDLNRYEDRSVLNTRSLSPSSVSPSSDHLPHILGSRKYTEINLEEEDILKHEEEYQRELQERVLKIQLQTNSPVPPLDLSDDTDDLKETSHEITLREFAGKG